MTEKFNGPWTWTERKLSPGHRAVEVWDGEGMLFADVFGPNATDFARLMAAAPTMVGVLSDGDWGVIEDAIERLPGDPTQADMTAIIIAFRQLNAKRLAALARAKGEADG